MPFFTYPIIFKTFTGEVIAGELVTEVALPIDFWTLTPATNGAQYSGYPAGNPPGPAWSAVPNFLNETTSVSVNVLTTYLTPTSGVTCVLTGTLPTGWSFNGTTLAYNGTSVNSSPTTGLYFTATLISTGVSVTSNPFSVSGAGSPTSDTFAPTVPLGLTSSAVTATTATISGYTPSDPNPAGFTWSGLGQINVKQTPPGSVVGHTTIGPGNQPVFSLADIGSPSPPSTFSQTGADITLVNTQGLLYTGTSDQFAFAPQQITGTNWVLSCKISSFASSYAFSFAGLMARTSLAAGSAHIFAFTTPIASGNGFNSIVRSAANASATVGSLQPNGGSPLWIVVVRSGDTYSSYYSLDGNTFTAIGAPVTQVMGSTIYVGPALCCEQNSLAVTCVFQQVSLQTLGNWSYNATGLSASTAYQFAATAQDTAGTPNVSALSASISVSTPGTGGTIKWNPGHYVIPNARPNVPSAFSIVQAAINDMDAAYVSPTERFMGLQIEPNWYALETAAGGHYYFDQADSAYTSSNVIDQALAALAIKSAARGVDYKLIIYLPLVEALAHGVPTTPQAAPYGAGASSTSIAPDYVINAGYVFNNENNFSATRCWQSGCGTAIINLLNALGRVYDSNPHVEMVIPIYETAVNSSNITDPTYSVAAYTSFINSLQAAMSTAWPTTQKCIFINYGGIVGSTGMTNAQVTALATTWISTVGAAANPGFCMGGPDLLYQADDGAPTQGDEISRGVLGSQNYQGLVGLCWEEQANAFNWTDQTSAGTEAYGYGTLKCSHIVWSDTPTGEGNNTSATWPTVVAALNAVNFRIAGSSKPSSYT